MSTTTNEHQPPSNTIRRLQKQQPPQRSSSPKNEELPSSKQSGLLVKRGGAPSLPQQRPPLPDRLPSFSKRHASFDSPREVPLPSPSLLRSSGGEPSYFTSMPPGDSAGNGNLPKSRPNSLTKRQAEEAFTPVFEDYDSGWTSVSAFHQPKQRTSGNDQAHQELAKISTTTSSSSSKQTPPASPSRATTTATPLSSQILPYSRPYSLPHSSSGSSTAGSTSSADETYLHHQHKPNKPSSFTASTIDRSSSASLPLPTQIPFHTLPRVGDIDDRLKLPSGALVGDVAKSTTVELEEPVPLEGRPPLHTSGSGGSVASSTTSSSASSSSLPSVPGPTDSPPSPPSSHSPQPLSEPSPTASSTLQSDQHYPHKHDPPNSSGVGAFDSAVPSASTAAYGSTSYPSTPSSYGTATAIRRSYPAGASSPSTIPPPEPPMILSFGSMPPPPPPPSSFSPYTPVSGSRASTSSTSTAASMTSGFSRASADTSLTSPTSEPGFSSQQLQPQRLHGRSVTTSTSRPSSSSSAQPPYAPFLSHAPPPADSWIEVETTPTEYKLNVRLPGFKRDGITLATKRRRILHVVADSWENGGGHFERRISFGYDADLVQVRAEFDGEILKVIVPRRATGMYGVGY